MRISEMESSEKHDRQMILKMLKRYFEGSRGLVSKCIFTLFQKYGK